MPDPGRSIPRNRMIESRAIPLAADLGALNASRSSARTQHEPVVVEAPSTPHNQKAGCMCPAPCVPDSATQARTDARRNPFGGDRLGPQASRRRTPERAMKVARRPVADCTGAEPPQIPPDGSDRGAGDPATLPDTGAARRPAAALQRALSRRGLLLLTGTEVPSSACAGTDHPSHNPPPTLTAARATVAASIPLGQISGLVVQSGNGVSPTAVLHLPIQRAPHPPHALTAQVCPEVQLADDRLAKAHRPLAGRAAPCTDAIRPQPVWSAGISRPKTLDAMMREKPAPRQAHVQRHTADPRANRTSYSWPVAKSKAAAPRRPAALRGRRRSALLLTAHFAPSEIASPRASAYPLPRAWALARVQTAFRPPFRTGPRP